jgi:hypothetical protein
MTIHVLSLRSHDRVPAAANRQVTLEEGQCGADNRQMIVLQAGRHTMNPQKPIANKQHIVCGCIAELGINRAGSLVRGRVIVVRTVSEACCMPQCCDSTRARG